MATIECENIQVHKSAVDRTMVEEFELTAALYCEKVALIYNETSINYRDLNEQANRIASWLRANGCGRETLVGVYLEQSIERVIWLLSVLKAGGAYLPLDTNYPTHRIMFMLEDSQAGLLITNRELANNLPGYGGKVIILENDRPFFDGHDGENLEKVNTLSDLIYLIYTSGSTGNPKGVLIEHGSVSNFIFHHNTILGISSDSKVLQICSISFDVAVIDLWLPLLQGATVYLYADNKILGAPLLHFIRENQLDVIPFITPTVLTSLPVDESIGNVRVIGVGGEVCPDPTVRNWMKRVNLINTYGPTETTVCVTTFRFKEGFTGPVIGKPGPKVNVLVLDDELREVPDGIVGELFIGGIQVARGYWNRPEITREKFIPYPFALSPENGTKLRFYRTGDLVKHLGDGNLEFLGRKDNQVKIRGYRIELGEIESILLRQPGIKHAVVTVQENNAFDKKLIAYVVHGNSCVEGEDADKLSCTLNERLKQILPAFMMPYSYVFMTDMPLNENGKIDRKAFPAWSGEGLTRNIRDEAPANELEAIIKSIWMTVLQLPGIGMTADFFEMGGHSVLITMVYRKLPDRYRETLPLQDLFRFTTIRGLADALLSRVQGGQTQIEWRQSVLDHMLKDAERLPDIFITPALPRGNVSNPTYILLTGATGFVGAHLLTELLEKTSAIIYCLIRASNDHVASERLRQAFRKFSILLDPLASGRVRPISGDLAKPSLGLDMNVFEKLAHEVDIIYHAGGSVSYIEPYPLIRKPNVEGILEIIRLAALCKLKCIANASTLAVFSWGHYFTRKVWMKEDEDLFQNLESVSRGSDYVKTKWVEEMILLNAASKGIPVVNFRLGVILCHSQTGVAAPNQVYSRLVPSCIKLKKYPLMVGLKESLTSVDYVAKAMVYIASQKEAEGKNFHLSPDPDKEVSLTDLFDRINTYFGTAMTPIAFQDWRDLWQNDETSDMFPILSIYKGDVCDGNSLMELYQNNYYFDRSNAAAFLKESGIRPNVIDKTFLSPFLKQLGVWK